MRTERVYLSLGGNLGDPAASIGEALRLIEAEPGAHVAAVSALYRTPPWGKLDQSDFLNAAARIETTFTPRAFLDLCLATERRLKRERGERWGPRLIDLDILLFGQRHLDEHGLEVPHPRMLDRAFVLVPLQEIAPGLDLAGTSIEDRLRKLDRTGITQVSDGADWWKAA